MPILVSRVAARRFTGLGFGKAVIRLCQWQTNWTCRRKLYQALNERLQDNDKEAAIELYYELLSSGYPVGEN